MSVRTTRTLFCNGDQETQDCPGWFDHLGDLESAAQARKRAHQSGWTQGPGGEDFCPTHSKLREAGR